MIQYHIYPGGKKRIVTFSYDDGNPNDIRLVKMFNEHGVKGSFHLNGMYYQKDGEEKFSELRKLYSGHEISCHTFSHGWPARMPSASLVNEIMKDRVMLEKIAQYPVLGMSYPSGSFNDDVVNVLKSCGIVYSRTTKSTYDFALPDNFLTWHPTCHHKNALELCDTFMEKLDSQWENPLFYIWGHSHEFWTEEKWDVMKRILDKLSGSDKIWYATNMEIYDYLTAQQKLKISADEKIFTNPTSIDLWVERDKKDIICIPAGKTIIC